MVTANKREINIILRSYKNDNGSICFPALFAIDKQDRIPELAKKDYAQMAALITAGLTFAFESMNLTRQINTNQIVDLTEMVIDTSNEDNLSLEDVMLFLQKLTRGEYGKLYESMDIPKFMDMFEVYREQRWQAINQMREDQQVQHKALPENSRLLTLRDLLSTKDI